MKSVSKLSFIFTFFKHSDLKTNDDCDAFKRLRVARARSSSSTNRGRAAPESSYARGAADVSELFIRSGPMSHSKLDFKDIRSRNLTKIFLCAIE